MANAFPARIASASSVTLLVIVDGTLGASDDFCGVLGVVVRLDIVVSVQSSEAFSALVAGGARVAGSTGTDTFFIASAVVGTYLAVEGSSWTGLAVAAVVAVTEESSTTTTTTTTTTTN